MSPKARTLLIRLAAAALSLVLLASADSGIDVTYIANEGFLIAGGGDKVLIDGLMSREFLSRYSSDGATLAANISLGRSPFDGIELALITHVHSDHIHADTALRFLSSNKNVTMLAPAQVVAQLRERGGYEAVKSRIRTVTPALTKSETLDVNGINVTALRLRHAPQMVPSPGTGEMVDRHAEIQNLGFVLSLDGKKILHVGDSGLDLPREYEPYRSHIENVEVGFFPSLYWTPLASRAQIVNEWIKPRNIVLMHLSPAATPGTISPQHQAAFPKVVIFKKPLESRKF
jgi:L-ascorbate metabolism protein UlaG (beta-lactamase superfamily)